MKKLLFLFAVLLSTVSGWAQPKVSDAPSDGQWADNTTWFVMSTLSGYLYGSDFVDGEGQLKLSETKTNTAGEHLLWSIVEGENGKYYIYNKAKGVDYVLGIYPQSGNVPPRAKFVEKNTSGCTTLFEIVSSQKSTNAQEYWCLREAGTNKYWNRQNAYLTYWNSASALNDNGSAHMFVESEIVEGMEYEFTDNVGNSFTGTFTGMKSSTFVQPSYTGVDVATLSNLSCTESKFSATINFPFPVSKEGGATNWRFIETAKVSERNTYISVRTSDNRIITRSTHADNGMSYLPIADLDEIKKWMWAFYPEFDNEKGIFSFKIKNAATGLYVPSSPSPTSSNKVQDNISVTTEQESGSFSWGTCIGSGKGFYCKDDSNIVFGANSTDPGDRGAMLWYKNGTHAGCNLNIILPRYYVNYSLTDNSGLKYTKTCSVEYTPNTTGELAEPTPTLTGIPSDMISGATFENNTYTATINFPFPISKEGGVTNATLLANWGNADNNSTKKWHAVLEDGVYNLKVQAKNPELTDLNTWRWAIYPQFADGVFTFKIKNMHTGTYVYANPANTANAGGQKGYIILNEEGTAFTIVKNGNFVNLAYVGKNSTTLKLTTNGSGDTDVYLGSYTGEHSGNHINWPEFTTYALTTGTTGYAAGYTPIAVTVPDGVTVYKGNMVTANKASLIVSEVEDITIIPANTAVIIKGDPSTTYTFAKSNTDGTAIEGNVLMGSANSAATSSIQGGVPYTLQGNGTFAKYGAESIPGYNVYIKLPTGTTNPVNMLGEEGFVDGVEDFVQGGVYTFVSSKGWMGATETCDNVISTAKTTHNVTGSAANDMFQWTVYKSNNGNYYLYNIGKRMFMGVQSSNNASVPFANSPAGKKLTFKNSNVAGYPIMFSTDNAAVVNHNGSFGDGCISWTGGWNNLTDTGNAHQVTLVKTLTNAELQTIADIVEAYDKQLYVRAEVEGLEENNPNTHFGSVIATNASTSLYKVLKKNNSDIAYLDYDGLKETTISFGREYRGFEFQGFKVGEQELDKSFVLNEVLKNSITAETPLVAKVRFNGTKDVTLFSDDDEFSYRIPAITTTGTGRIIAVSDYRHNLDDIGRDNHGTGTKRIDLVMRYSEDNGATWSEKQTIAEGSGNKNADGYDCAYGDAAIAAVGEKVLVMAAAGNVVFTGGSSDSHNRTVRLFSEDNGATWTKEDISETLFIGDDATIKNGYSAFFGSGKLAVDTKFIGTPEKPRIYGAMLIRKSNGTSISNYNNYAIYSDDFGLTWHILGSDDNAKQTPIASGDEPKMEILPNGQILLSVRRGGGRIFNVFTYGTGENDKANGIGTWNGNLNGCDNGGVSCNGETFCVDAKKTDGTSTKLLLQSQPHGGDRNNVSIWYKEISAAADATHTSADIAGNWTLGLQVSTQKSAYSAMTLQKDGKIGFFFEEAPCFGDDHTKGYCMVYMPLSISEITNGKYGGQNAEVKAVNVNVTDDMSNSYNLALNIFADDEEAIKDLVKATWSFAEFVGSPELTKEGNTYTYRNIVTLPFKVSNNDNTYWHNIYLHGGGDNELYYLYADAADATLVSKKSDGENHPYGDSQWNTAEHADNMSWSVYHAGNFTFNFKNKLTGKFIQVTGVANGNAENVKFVEEGATAFEIVKDVNNSWKGDYSLKASVSNTVGYLCNTSYSYAYATHYTGNSHEGGWLNFEEAPDFTSLIAEVSNVLSLIGENLQQYTVTAANTETAAQAKNAMQDPNKVKLNVLNTYKNLMDGATLNLPAAGQFYRIKSYSNDRYLGNTVDDTSDPKTLITVNSNEADPSIIYYFEPGPTNGQYYLMSYANGHYLANPWRIGVGSETIPTTNNEIFKQYTEIAEGQRTMYVLKYANGSNNLIKVSEQKTNYSTDKDADDAQWTFEPVAYLPFTFKKAALGFATFNAPVAVQLPENVIAYVAQIVDESTLKMRKFISEGEELVVVPANTPVMLYKENVTADIQISLKIEEDSYSEAELADIKAKNNFYGTIEAETYPEGATVYSLQKNNSNPDKVGFYQKSSGNLGGFKAWIKTTTSNARAFTIIFDGDDATGLKEALGLENENVEIYDLSGRRLDKPAKGVNVIGGKLVIK